MNRLPPALSTGIVAVVFVGAAAFIALSLARIPNMAGLTGFPAAAPSRGGPAEGAPPPASDPGRPAEVGDAQADSFLGKIAEPLSVPAEGLIRLEDETFSAFYDELYDRRALYYGREIELAGTVMLQEGLAGGDFLVGRKLLWCCESDMYFIGFLAYRPEGPVPREGEKIRIRGTLEPREYRNPETGKSYAVPAVRVAKVFPEPDLSERVYPPFRP